MKTKLGPCEKKPGKNQQDANQQGATLIEFILIFTLVIAVVLATADGGLAFYAYHRVSVAAREGARVATALPNLVQNDSRIVSTVTSQLSSLPFYNNLVIENTDQTVAIEVQTRNGDICNREVTVNVSLDYPSLFPDFWGRTSTAISQSTSMRYNAQPLCF